ncbi:hypothetical protein Vpro01_02111 [Vibrio proteolyticus]
MLDTGYDFLSVTLWNKIYSLNRCFKNHDEKYYP